MYTTVDQIWQALDASSIPDTLRTGADRNGSNIKAHARQGAVPKQPAQFTKVKSSWKAPPPKK